MNEKEEIRIGRRVTWVGFWSNLGLSILKVIAGVAGRSSAMVADGVHSASDLLTDVAVLIVIGASRKKADSGHAYGHGKIETFVTFLIALLLLVVGIGFMIGGSSRVAEALSGSELPHPGMIALIMAVASIIVKELLFRYTRRIGRKIKSSSMEANAWHHRSDSLSSLATMAGIAGAMFLGASWRILDPLAAIAVSILVIIMAVKLGIRAIKELLEAALPEEDTKRMEQIISQTPGVVTFHRFRSRQNGNTRIVDLHIQLDPALSIVEAHDIATEVERRLKKEFSPIVVNIHMEPYEGSH